MSALLDVGVNIIFVLAGVVAVLFVRPLMRIVASSLLRPRARTVIVRRGDVEASGEVAPDAKITDAVADIKAGAEFRNGVGVA
jgi:hypothetical protein